MDPLPIIDADTSQNDFSNNEVPSQLYQTKQDNGPNNVSSIRNQLTRGQLEGPNGNNQPPPVDRRDVPEHKELEKLPVQSATDNSSTLPLDSVSTGIISFHETTGELNLRDEDNNANEPTTPLQYLLLENPDHLCWLNTNLNILHKADDVRENFSTSSTGDPICDSVARIFQGVEKSAESLRLLLTNTKFHTGPQDAAEALISLMHDLKMEFKQKRVKFCNGCNTILMRFNAVVCSQCETTRLTEGYLLTYERTRFLISCDKIPVLAPNQEFKIGSERDSVEVGYRLNAFAQFISEENFAHYVAWIRKPEANKESITENNNECEHDIQEDTNKEQRKINNTNTTVENNQEVYECEQIVPEIPAEYPSINQPIDNNQNENILEYSIGEHFICVDDHQISIENVKSIKDYHINVMLLEPCKQLVE